jgi:hypothetical protein
MRFIIKQCLVRHYLFSQIHFIQSVCRKILLRIMSIPLPYLFIITISISQTLSFKIDKDDVDDILLYTQGYYKLFTGKELPCQVDDVEGDGQPPGECAIPWRGERLFAYCVFLVPPYAGLHSVRPAGWNYARTSDRCAGSSANEQVDNRYINIISNQAQTQRLVDLSTKLPSPDTAANMSMIGEETDDDIVRLFYCVY